MNKIIVLNLLFIGCGPQQEPVEYRYDAGTTTVIVNHIPITNPPQIFPIYDAGSTVDAGLPKCNKHDAGDNDDNENDSKWCREGGDE